MAAYAALFSLMYTIKQIEHHPRPPLCLDKTQVESLTEKVTFLQEFLEGYSHLAGYSKEADPLEIRIADAAYAAEDVIESHIVDQIQIQIHVGSSSRGEVISSFDLFEGLQKVIEDMDLIMKKEVMEIKEKVGGVQHQLPVASLRSSFNTTMVGFDDLLIEVMDKLTRGQLDLQTIPIVGMGGIGKTTLARNIYQNQAVAQHFDVLAWVTVSQDYKMRDIISQLLQKVGRGSNGMDDYNNLGDKLYKELSGRRYLIFLDDVWDIQVWDQLRRFFPTNNNGSRIVMTTRISDFLVIDSYVVKMRFLDEDQSWSLFSKIVFGEESCLVEMKGIAKNIVESCRGLPLSIVVVGGLLAKSRYTQEYWEYVAENLNSIVNLEDDESCLKILHMSYNQLPIYLKPCFLYMGVYPEDEVIHVPRLIKLWVAEGFLKPISGKSWEEIAEEYLKQLINRNLVLVHKLGCTGNIKYCYLHDLLRDLCLREAQKQKFYNVIRQHSLDPQDLNSQRRVVIPYSTSREEIINALQYMSLTRTLICDAEVILLMHNFRLLRITSSLNSCNTSLLEDKLRLVNSRFIFLCADDVGKIPSSLDLLWNLHTLIVEGFNEFETPVEIWNMPQLRHLDVRGGLNLQYPLDGGKDGIVMKNLQTLETVINFKCRKEVVKRIPNIKKLKVTYHTNDGRDSGFNNFYHLQKLESLQCEYRVYYETNSMQNLTLPHSLKRLKLEVTKYYNWKDHLEKIGSLPCLEKLSLSRGSFQECKWKTVEGQFRKLKFLRIESCGDLKYWMTESSHFPCLEHLVLESLIDFNGIPSEIGEIATLKSITLVQCNNSTIISAKHIQDEQEELYGEVGIQVRVR